MLHKIIQTNDVYTIVYGSYIEYGLDLRSNGALYFMINFIYFMQLNSNLTNILIFIYNIYNIMNFFLIWIKRASVNKTFKQPSFYEAIRPLFSTFYLFIIQMVWIQYSRVNILDLEPRVFYWVTGTLFSNISVGFTQQNQLNSNLNLINFCFFF